MAAAVLVLSIVSPPFKWLRRRKKERRYLKSALQLPLNRMQSSSREKRGNSVMYNTHVYVCLSLSHSCDSNRKVKNFVSLSLSPSLFPSFLIRQVTGRKIRRQRRAVQFALQTNDN